MNFAQKKKPQSPSSDSKAPSLTEHGASESHPAAGIPRYLENGHFFSSQSRPFGDGASSNIPLFFKRRSFNADNHHANVRADAMTETIPTPAGVSHAPVFLKGGTYNAAEQEADAVADALAGGNFSPPVLSQKVAPDTPQGKTQGNAAQGTDYVALHSLPGAGAPLHHDIRNSFGPRLGQDLSSVRIHTDSGAQHAARAFGASAFTVGESIGFAPGAYQPSTASGRWLIGHELAHVAQKRLGVAPGLHEIPTGAQCKYGPFNTVPAGPRETPAGIRAMTLGDFVDHASDQLDWAVSPSLAASADLPAFRDLLAFAREQNITEGCGAMGVNDLLNLPYTTIRPQLEAYSRGVATNDTAWIEQTPTVTQARDWGAKLIELETACTAGTLSLIMRQPESGDGPFKRLFDSGYVSDFCTYVTSCSPVLSADNGKEITSYLLMRNTDSVDPIAYHNRIRFVKTFHHFTKTALDALNQNEMWPQVMQALPVFARPLTVILFPTVDHNGAFHRAASYEQVIINRDILTIVIEGHPDLGGYEAQLPIVAGRYGIGGRIEQALLGGHGNASGIILAGSVNAGQVDNRWIQNSGSNQGVQDSRDLLTSLTSLMHADPARRRIVVDVCLTASHSVNTELDPNNPQDAARIVLESIGNRPGTGSHAGSATNIIDFIQGIAGSGAPVIGASASYNDQGVSFLDPNGQLTLSVQPDPHIIGDKIFYVELGIEPSGALRAVLECWALDHIHPVPTTTCFDAMTRRLNRTNGSTDWNEVIIRSLYELILLSYRPNGEKIRQMAGLAGVLSHVKNVEDNQASSVDMECMTVLSDPERTTVFTALSKATLWGNTRVALVMNQAWMQIDTNKAADVKTLINQYPTCDAVARFLSMDLMLFSAADLLPARNATSASPEERAIAMMLAYTYPDTNPDTSAVDHHIALLRSILGTATSFPSALNIAGILGGYASEDDILDAIGRSRSAPVTNTPSTRQTANVDLDNDGTNDFYLTPYTARGVVAHCSRLNVRSLPGMDGSVLSVISRGDAVQIVGRHRGWLGIEHAGRVAFVYQRFIDILP